MKPRPTIKSSGVKRATCGSTLAEVLAALSLMIVVIPVAVQGILVANRAGVVGARKLAAGRVAERVMNELGASGQWMGGAQSGRIEEGAREYQWSVQSQTWSEANLNEVTVRVTFAVQGQDYGLELTTLIDPYATNSSSLSAGAGGGL